MSARPPKVVRVGVRYFCHVPVNARNFMRDREHCVTGSQGRSIAALTAVIFQYRAPPGRGPSTGARPNVAFGSSVTF